MGNRVSHCFVPEGENHRSSDIVFYPHRAPPAPPPPPPPPPPLPRPQPLQAAAAQADEGLGHSFYYGRVPSRSGSSIVSGACDRSADAVVVGGSAFRSISGASVSANTSTPRTIVLGHDGGGGGGGDELHRGSVFANVPEDRHAAFESTPSFASLPLQPVPRGTGGFGTLSFPGPISGSGHEQQLQQHRGPQGFMSGPLLPDPKGFLSGPLLERGFLSGPLERASISMSGPFEIHSAAAAAIRAPSSSAAAHFSHRFHRLLLLHRGRRQRREASKRSRSSLDSAPRTSSLTRTISSTLARTRRSIVAPVRRRFVAPCHGGAPEDDSLPYGTPSELPSASSDNAPDSLDLPHVHWAQGKAGEDRIHVVVSDDHRLLFVGIYDGFSGPDAPDFLMRNLYSTVYKELQGVIWASLPREGSDQARDGLDDRNLSANDVDGRAEKITNRCGCDRAPAHGIRPPGEMNNAVLSRSRTLRELLADADVEEADVLPSDGSRKHRNHGSGLSSASQQQKPEACWAGAGEHKKRTLSSHADALANSNVSDANDERASTTWSGHSCVITNQQHRDGNGHKNPLLNRSESVAEGKELMKEVDHDAVLKALARALELTEQAYLAMADHALEENPELALMGSCILVAIMKDNDVYVLNVGDSRAIVAQERSEHSSLSGDTNKRGCGRDMSNKQDLERISEESPVPVTRASGLATTFGPSLFNSSLDAVQLSIDHSTSIEEEVRRIKAEHPDDNTCILNDRVKGRLKVTRAFGAGFLKKPRWNSAILEMFQIEYIGSSPYVNCIPALHHHRLGPRDRFLILSSDGLYQYFSNQEVVSYVDWFTERFPEGDPAQYLIEELLFRAAKKAGMDFHELLEVPQGDRRKYHDDVSVMVIAIDGRMWSSSG